jgi:hypothetical protein
MTLITNAQLETSYINLVYPLYTIMLYTLMRKGPGSAYDKWNISVVICDTGILYNKEATMPRVSYGLKFFARHHDSVNPYGIPVSQMTTDMFHLS